jgi:epsin
MDEERLRTERANRGSWKSRVTGLEDMGAMGGYQGEPSAPHRENRQRARTHENEDNDLEFRLALEASKNEADEASKRKPQGTTDNDDDLAKALKLSREEEELRKREQDDQNQANLLFDDTPAQAPQPTGFNQGYQQQAAVDWFGNPVQQQQQQPQQTGYLNNAYNQPTGMQPQQTGFQNGYGGYGYQQQQPQQTGFQQQQSLQPQNTYNPWAQQMNGYGQQQQQQQQPIQEQQTATPGSNNPWAIPAQSQTPIGVQPTGSNNPFATHRPPQSTTPKAPTLSSLQEQQTSNQFNQRVNPIANFSPSPAPQQQQAPIQQQNTQDPYQSRLNALLASGEGQDTFGNTGDMRLPAQHTAPGTFVNSAGAGSMGRLEAAKTGNNPFFSQGGQQQSLQSQYTGMPATQFPAQTGFGASQGNNPFGARPGQQGQQQQQQGGGSLIDL